VETPAGGVYRVISFIDAGDRGSVYRAVDERGRHFVLKIAVDNDEETLVSFLSETRKTYDLERLGANVAPILEHGGDFMVKPFAEGVRGDAWLREWIRNGSDLRAPGAVSLVRQIRALAAQGAFVLDFHSKNLIFNGNEWVIVDAGDVTFGLDPAKAFAKFQQSMVEHWSRIDVRCTPLFQNAADVGN
jgi:hypothetical protein